ncbi:hypothetical protein AYL99_03177 [Fonsecaea erecta]|uniref:Uncharacterized protein n=1 Tax=Fonsecaea erecta TaxID=1367422 RepID=A0A178ZVX3_9EURO|nr:hypothetical protein AYL99_03177 [Fonsecaea erecta]OAP63950.1 hypothetical protein AYL99_03177 [Fonsecaea erecta]
MCFGNSKTIDDPTQPAVRSTNLWSHKVHDPTQQPIYTTESNDAEMTRMHSAGRKERKGGHKDRPEFVDMTDESNMQGPRMKERRASHKDRPEYVDVTDREVKPKARTLSDLEADAARLVQRDSGEAVPRRKKPSWNTFAYGAGVGAVFAANPSG